MHDSYEYRALSRLRVTEGLVITADFWKHDQSYQRHRQNIYCRSLYQPGIVEGFGVKVIPSDVEKPDSFRLQISKGIAIDVAGNPVVLPGDCRLPIPFKLVPERSHRQFQTIYVVARYQDPETPDLIPPDYIDADDLLNSESPVPSEHAALEHCQIVERLKLFPGDIELCRIQLERNAEAIQPAPRVYAPGLNCLDFRYRAIAQLRPQGRVQVSQLYFDTTFAQSAALNFQSLLTATETLYPALQGNRPVVSVVHNAQEDPAVEKEVPLLQGQLTYVPYDSLGRLSNLDLRRLKQQLVRGGVILIAVDPNNQPLKKLRRQLLEGFQILQEPPNFESRDNDDWKRQINGRITQLEETMDRNIKAVYQRVNRLAQQLGVRLQGDGYIATDHPLRCVPFNFSSWPTLEEDPLEVRCWENIVLVLADISDIWAVESEMMRSRQSIRTTQEWGTNLLHYAWEHHHLTQLQQGKCSRE